MALEARIIKWGGGLKEITSKLIDHTGYPPEKLHVDERNTISIIFRKGRSEFYTDPDRVASVQDIRNGNFQIERDCEFLYNRKLKNFKPLYLN